MADVAPSRPPLWRDIRFLRIAAQVLFVVIVAILLREMYLNAAFQLERRGTEMSYDFLDTRAGFGIKEHVISYSPNNDYLRAFMVGYTNAVLLGMIGIVLATLLGLVIGVARLSPNWLLRKISQVYVEFFRNTPLLVQVVFWWSAVFLAAPRIQNAFSIGDLVFISNRELALPMLRSGARFGAWALAFSSGLVLAALAWLWRNRVHERTGRPHRRALWSLGVLLGVSVAAYLLLGDAFYVERPQPQRFGFEGGLGVTPSFGGVLVGLVVYTAAFIAEIVRGSILAVSRGQKEAGMALGLTPGQQLRLVVLPQALRIAIPPINNQYLNLWKNTSLAFAVGYPELINISSTIINQAGSELQVFALVVLAYLLTSLAISFVMNLVNRAVALKGAHEHG